MGSATLCKTIVSKQFIWKCLHSGFIYILRNFFGIVVVLKIVPFLL